MARAYEPTLEAEGYGQYQHLFERDGDLKANRGDSE